MPLLGKKIFVCVKPLVNRKSEETLYSIPHTKEQFRSKQDYEKRISLYENCIWTCQSTGHTNLTHEEAWNSEKSVRKSVKSQYQACYEKPVLDIVHHSTYSLDTLVDQTWLKLQQVLSIDENISLKIRTSGKIVNAKVARVDTCGIEANPTSNCSSPSSDKENTNENSVNKDLGQKKWVPPKLLPYKYSIKLEEEDKIINCVPAADLTRVDRPPSKELLRLFIRTHALRAGQTFSSPWVVDETMIKKHTIQNKIADVFLSPMKIQEPVTLNETGTKKRKLSLSKSGSSNVKKAKIEKEKEKKKKTVVKKKKNEDENGKTKKKQSKLDAGSTKKMSTLKKKVSNPKSKSSAIDTSEADSDSSEEYSLRKLKKKLPKTKDADDIPLSTLKQQRTPVKMKKSDSRQSTPKKDSPKKNSPKKGTPKKGTPKKNKSPQKDQTKSKKKPVKDDDKKKKEKEKKKREKLKNKMKEKMKDKVKEKVKEKPKDKGTPKKGKNMKQMTLLEMSAKKGPRTPDKKKTVTAASPQKPPLIVRKLITAMKNKDSNKTEYKKILQKVILLSAQQREKLPAEVKSVVQKAYELHEEKKKLKSMSADEREAYLQKKKEESKRKQAEERRAKQIELGKKRRELNKRYEDKDLEDKALPQPKMVPNPDGLPVEAFGDVTMITEFINCFSGLLMPQEEQVFYTDLLLKGLVCSDGGFSYISQILVILLQTLLQDEISEDYSELNTPLSDIPVNPYTASELVRLALRKNDSDGPEESQSDNSSEDEGEEELEVNDELIGMLENHELQDLEPMQKLQILKGLCLRIMGTYSVQDFMEQKQAESSSLWRRKFSAFKEKKQQRELCDMKMLENKLEDFTDTKENNPKNGNVKEEESRNIKSSGLTITDFYGNKIMEDNDEEIELMQGGLASVVKRRRQRTAVAAQEKEKRDQEERERREKEQVVLRKVKEEAAFEKAFADGILLAKLVLRLSPIGTDRNHNRYWIFSKCTPGLYIEKGWVPDAIRYTVQTKPPVEESSESSDDEAIDDEQKDNRKDIETSVPNSGQNMWFVYDTVEELNNLMSCLHPQGVRESALKIKIRKHWDDLVKNVTTNKRVMPKEENACEKSVEAGFKKELKETETRLRNGGLGGVYGQDEWEQKLDNAVSLSEYGNLLLETQSYVLERFRQGIMGKSSKQKAAAAAAAAAADSDKKEDTAAEGTGVKEVEEKELINVGYQRWKEAVESCNTFSRMHVLLGILDACIRWEKSAENAKCKICRKKGVGEQLILCDECNQAFHLYCLRPALPWIPEGDWYCPACVPQSERRSRRTASRKYDDYGDEDSDVDDSAESEMEHESNCVVCDGGDELIQCYQCPDVYHLECHDPPLRHPPRGQWICTSCKTGRKRKKSRRVVKKKRSVYKKVKYSELSEDESEEDDESESEEKEDDAESEEEDNEIEYIPKKWQIAKMNKQKKNVKTTKSRADIEEEEESEEQYIEEEEEEKEEEEEEEECEDVSNSDEEYVSAVAAQCQEEFKASVSTQTSFTEGAVDGSSRQTGTQTSSMEYYTSQRQQLNMELSICEAILIRLIMNKESWPFRLPVNEKEAPDYYELIVNPIDLRTIKHKTVDREYKHTEHFIEDISLMFRNCASYNSVNSEVYRCMLVLEKQFTNLLSKVLPQYHYSRKMSNGYSDQAYTCYGTRKRGHHM